MATHQKTIRVPVNFCNGGTIPDAVLTTIGTPTIYIPENSVTNPITITSAMLFVYAQDMSTVTGGTITEMRVSAILSGASASTITELDDFSNTGENWGGIFGGWDFTTYFNTNFGTVTSKTCQVDVYFDISTGTTTTVNAVQGYWEITYSYDDSEPNRIQTIAIAMESSDSIAGALTTVANTAFCTIPQLTGAGGWLNGYASPVIRHIWAEAKGASGTTAAVTAQVLNWGFNGVGGGGARDSRNNSLATDTYIFSQIDLSSLTVSGTNTLDLWSSIASRFHAHVVTIYVSFEFVVSGTTRVLNYIEVPVEFSGTISSSTSSGSHRFKRSLLIPESGTITQRSIGIELSYNNNASANSQVKAGAQASYRNYAITGSVVATQFVFQHLLDARSASGSALTLVRGENDIVFDIYGLTMTNTSGILKVLYESDVSSAGIDSHSKTVYSLVRQYDNTAIAIQQVNGISFSIPNTNYWIQAAGLEYNFWLAAAIGSFAISARVLPAEAEGDGWRDLYIDQYTSDAEVAFGVWRVRARDAFKRHPNDADLSRLDIESARAIKTISAVAFRYGIKWLVSYHNITHTLSGNITNSAGGTVDLYLFRSSNNEVYEVSTRVGDGAYSFTVYDDVENYYVVAQESSTKKGVSYIGAPNTNFDIDLQPVGGGGATVGGRILIT